MKQSQLQQMLAVLQKDLTSEFSLLHFFKGERQYFWGLCDVDRKELTAGHFIQLNMYNNEIRLVKARIKTKSELSYSIKKLLKG